MTTDSDWGDHDVRVLNHYRPAETVTTDEGEELVLPAMVDWIVLCAEHEYYQPVMVMMDDIDRMGPETFGRMLELFTQQVQTQFTKHGCGATIPSLTAFGGGDATPSSP